MARNGRSVFGTFLLVGAAIVAFAAIDRPLARMERVESDKEAARVFQEGQHFQKSGRYSEAADCFRSAISIAGARDEFVIALAQTLLTAGKLEDAKAQLALVLERNSVNAEANLLMARTLAKQGKTEAAESYYHRAIYDPWPDDTAQHRIQTRQELISLLTRQNRHQELLSELLALQAEAGNNVQILESIAGQFLQAGSPEHAASIYREILHAEPHNARAFGGLGEAELAQGNYQQAEADFRHALHIDPDYLNVKARLALSHQVLELDPTR